MPHEHNKGAGKEHPKTHLILIGSIVMFVTICVLDAFVFNISTQLALFVPLIVRVILCAIFLVIGFVFQKLAHEGVFNGVEAKPLVKTGIFAHVRHPMYLSTPIFCIAFIFLTMSLISIVPVIITFIMYAPIVKYEEEELEKVFGQEYLDYKEKVPRWLPRLTPAKFNN